ncbi:unnamed protein product [Rhizoctonia solani]|uniref:F-box domain-containing protein n=1 Tax=Rhizoctonia solani TaxID=456999 RepID=A0A8H3HU21_9AGAM|nr:unnamed protein product [Rhizoctonia solani]
MVKLLEIPEIICLICEQVQRSDLAKLLTVCRLFFECAVPLVWNSLPGSAPTILIKLLPEADTYFRKDINSTINLRPLNAQALERFNFYAPYVRHLVRYFQNKKSNIAWDRLLEIVDARPILPNLEVLKLSLGNTIQDPALYLSPYLSPNIVEISHVRNTHSFTEPKSLCGLVLTIAQMCPRIRSLNLNNAASHMYAFMKPTHATELARSLGQLRNLRVLGLGRVVLDPRVLKALGALPNLESLALYETPGIWGSEEVPKLTDLSLPHSSFPALQNIGINPRFRPEPAILTWGITPLVHNLTSVSAHIDTPLTQAQASGFIRAICRYSPLITALCIDCTQSPSYIALLSPEIIANLAKLPLQRLSLSGKDVYSGNLDMDKERLVPALSFPRMEYLRIGGYFFTLDDLGLFAKQMPRLQQLSAKIELDIDCSPADKPPLLPIVSSPSQLYLHLRIFRRTTTQCYTELGCGAPQEAEAIAVWLHTLWPNGVVCEAGRRQDGTEEVNLGYQINTALRRLREDDGYGNQVEATLRMHPCKHVLPWLGRF